MKDEVRKDFERFHNKHPEVYNRLVQLAHEYQERRDKGSIWLLFNVLRWEHIIEGLPDPDEDFKLNNNYTPFYAREIMANEPELEGFFEVRKSRADA